jgi:hypothetical protein
LGLDVAAGSDVANLYASDETAFMDGGRYSQRYLRGKDLISLTAIYRHCDASYICRLPSMAGLLRYISASYEAVKIIDKHTS